MYRTLAILALMFSSSIAISSEEQPITFEEFREALTLDYLAEFSDRRRLTTFFRNEQSPFLGVQVNYVNVGAGNLTFLNRDLVRLDRMPLVFGRIYDSRKTTHTDFGQGWKLTVSEFIDDQTYLFTYTDASNSRYVLNKFGDEIVSNISHLTGIVGGRLGTHSITLDFLEESPRNSKGRARYID